MEELYCPGSLTWASQMVDVASEKRHIQVKGTQQSEGFHKKNCDTHLKGETPRLTLTENYSLYVQIEKKQSKAGHHI